MYSIKKDLLDFNNKLYIVKKLIREDHLPIIEVWKERLRADLILKKEGILYFLEEVVDLEIIS